MGAILAPHVQAHASDATDDTAAELAAEQVLLKARVAELNRIRALVKRTSAEIERQSADLAALTSHVNRLARQIDVVFAGSAREALKAMIREVGIGSLANMRPDQIVELVSRISDQKLKLPQGGPGITDANRILRETSDKYQVSVSLILSGGRNANLVVPRHEFFFRARTEARLSFPAIGSAYGFDRTSVMHGCARHAERIKNIALMDHALAEVVSDAA